ncbi:DUF58 domain-containing protein [Algiphilus sp.]|uniref:DUF58 domain-containing protein n=1 Tax=Algiphilus sp. TaxID=1872431 RepID=UPI0025C497A7|nr:DUF58 domain-containing protein [Algiphilus sp.]MCK5771615.1 DUF58 domain-containing protein [Algiphilus sp.]
MSAIADTLRVPFRRWQSAFERWLLRRVPVQPLPQRVGRRRVYIMPTPAGYAFGVMVFALWLGAMNYSNSMGFALAFLLAGVGLVGMHLTHANLLGLRLEHCDAQPVFAGESARVALRIAHEGDAARPGVRVGWPRDTDDSEDAADLPATGTGALTLRLPAPRRGRHSLPPLSLSTRFPLGLFRAWTWIRPEVALVVYPRPLPGPLPARAPHAPDGQQVAARSGRDTFDTLRDYRRGDALHDIHWKRLPKDGMPTVKQFHDATDRHLWLDWESTPGDPEARLSRLAGQILAAEARDLAWGLRLPGFALAPGRGDAHRHRGLRALALFGEPGSA